MKIVSFWKKMQSKRDVHTKDQHLKLLSSLITASNIYLHALLTVIMQSHADRPAIIHLFHQKLNTQDNLSQVRIMHPLNTTR